MQLNGGGGAAVGLVLDVSLTRSSVSHHIKILVFLWNVGTVRGRSNEVVEVMSRRKVDICGLQEVRWRGACARLVEGKDSRYKMFWVGNDKSIDSVGILLAEKWVEAIFDVTHVPDRIMLIKLAVGKSIVTVLWVYAPQAGLDDKVKDLFYENLQWTLTKISASEISFVCGYFNGHSEKNAHGYEGVHGDRGFGRRNLECERMLEFAVAHNLVVSNSLFTKVKLITSWSSDRISN